MKRQIALAHLLVLSLSLSSIVAQQQQRPPAPPPQQQNVPPNNNDDDVVRISTNLVQVDAVVTDRDGKQVTDLRADEFEIREDNRPQTITNFSYVSIESPPAPASTTTAKDSPARRDAPPVPPRALRPEQVRRTITLVVDDLGLSFESTHFVRQALRKYVDEQMAANDLVAIIRTSAGIGALQQFTSDKRQLYAAIERVRWYPNGRGGISAFAPISSLDEAGRTAGDSNGESTDSDLQRRNREREDVDTFREDIFAVGTLGALNFIVRGLRELPGRKAVVMFSDGFRLFNRVGGAGESNTRILESLRRLTDLANRASVVIYTIDSRGLQTLGLTAADDTSGLSASRLEERLTERRNELFDTQEGLNYLAQQTGGIAVRNNNDLSGGIQRALNDQKGYYLIGYRPDESTFDPATGRRRYHKLTGKIKNRPDLRVRMRSGFYGFTDTEARPTRRTRGEQLIAALTSPFSSGGVPLRLTLLFGNAQQGGSFMRSLLHIDGSKLSFMEEADGWRKTVIDVMAITFGDNGQVIDEVNRTETIRARGNAYQSLLRDGFVYMINVPVKKPGAYQLRVAVRDSATERTGSASQFIEVPNLQKNRLTLSGIVLNGEKTATKARSASNATAGQSAANNAAVNAESDLDPLVGPAARRFRKGMIINYGYIIYNAQLDRATRLPQLTTQIRLFRDGQQIFAGSPLPFDANGQTDLKRLAAAGRLQLGTNLQPGEYILQIVVTDTLAKEKYRITTQWTNFEIVE
ncbi:MAG: VWA domain-containing protein [Pyrinomonadaceae bacterium]|nr:VWA domain-containing protein [Pyrinomonadaceae bacterium]